MHSPPSTGTPSGFGVYRLSVGSFLLHPRRYLWWLYVTKGPAHLHLPAPPYSDLRSGQSPALCWWVSLACFRIPTSRKSLNPFSLLLSQLGICKQCERGRHTSSSLAVITPPEMSSGPHARSHCLQVAIAVSAQGASLCKNFSVLPGVTSLAHTLTVYNSEFGSPCFCYAPIYHGLSYRLLSVPLCIRILVPPAPVTPPALQWPVLTPTHTQFQLTHGGL